MGIVGSIERHKCVYGKTKENPFSLLAKLLVTSYSTSCCMVSYF
jgi:hypothetical protein